MLYFTLEVFRHLANQNSGHICVMLESYMYSRMPVRNIAIDFESKINSNMTLYIWLLFW